MTPRSVRKSKSHQNLKLLPKSNQNAKFNDSFEWRGVRDLNPRGPKDHRLSRPAPYQARATPHSIVFVDRAIFTFMNWSKKEAVID